MNRSHISKTVVVDQETEGWLDTVVEGDEVWFKSVVCMTVRVRAIEEDWRFELDWEEDDG